MAHIQGSAASSVDKEAATNHATPLSSTSQDTLKTPEDKENESDTALQHDAAVIVPSATITAATRKPNDIPGGDPTLHEPQATINEKDEHIAIDPAYAAGTEKPAAEVVTAEQDDQVEDDREYPNGFALGILTFGLCLATFVIALDNTIIGTTYGYEIEIIVG